MAIQNRFREKGSRFTWILRGFSCLVQPKIANFVNLNSIFPTPKNWCNANGYQAARKVYPSEKIYGEGIVCHIPIDDLSDCFPPGCHL